MVGASLSHYRILGQLGAGGMSAVYHALDTDLGRAVAIKLLRPEFALEPDRQQRFLQEARAAAALQHPNICTVHEVGRAGDELFIVMQLIDGRTLAECLASGPIPAARLRHIAVQLADALGAAHASGIVHRDLKPSNVMIGPDDRVTVLDFGVAAIAADRVYDPDGTTAIGRRPLTETGEVVGTIGYLSPEQIRGEHAGPESDVFAVGVTLYEAATGRNPFVRSAPLQTLAALLDDIPPPIRASMQGFPADLDEMCARCLHKRPERRFSDGAALAAALRGRAQIESAPEGIPRRRSIAVLPFATLQAQPGDEFLGEALAAEIITRLARSKGLRVTSRSSTLRFRGTGADAAQIGRELDVQTILEGGIARIGGRYHITLQLLDAANGFCVWADKYECAQDELFDVQEAVAHRVARALRARLSSPAAATEAPAGVNARAFELYLQGKALYYRFNSTDNLLAIEAFRRALKLDPAYARAHAAIASACMARLEREWETDEARWIGEALQACERAIATDAWLSDAYAARGLVFVRQHRLVEAEAEFRRALAINANDDIAHSMLGRLFFERGDLRQAARAFRRALKISPDYVWCWNDLAWVEWLLGRFEQTGRALGRVLAINPLDEIARVGIATEHYFRGELDEAVAIARKSMEINPHHPYSRPVVAVALAAQGRVTEAEALCREALADRPNEFLTSAGLALVYALAHDEPRLAEVNARALAIPADRAPLNVNIAIHFAFLQRPEIARLWLRKAFHEGLRSTIVLERNPLLRQFAPAP